MIYTNKKAGQGLVEYALIIALIALIAVVSLTSMGGTVKDGLWGNIHQNIDTAEQNIKDKS